MGDPAQAGFNTAQNQGNGLFEMGANEIGIDQNRAVGTFGIFPAGGVIITLSSTTGSRTVGHH